MAETGSVAPVVTLDTVTVMYGRNAALRDVTAAFAGGAVGLLGPNGAGKRTMIKSLLGFIAPHRGQMRVLRLDVAPSPLQIRARVGSLPGAHGRIPRLKPGVF